MKRVKKPVFFIIAALILALTYTSVFGVYTQNGDTKNTWIKGAGDIRWGIDIRGGVEATFSPVDGVEATAEQLEAAKAIIELRMVSKSITDYEIYTDEANDKIIVRFPWKSGESDRSFLLSLYITVICSLPCCNNVLQSHAVHCRNIIVPLIFDAAICKPVSSLFFCQCL